MDQKRVKAVWFNDPNKTREFTEVGFNYVTKERGWILADDQTLAKPVEKKTIPGVNPAAVVAAHNAAELEKARANYRTAAGQEPPKEWGEPKLFIETQKAIKLKASQPVIQEQVEIDPLPGTADNLPQEEVTEKVTEPAKVEKPKGKRGPKPKAPVAA